MTLKTLNYAFYPTNDLLQSGQFRNLRKVRCIALDDKKRVCMVSNDGTSHWMLPGGTIEKGENPILGLKRELKEEADIEIKNYQLIGFLEFHLHNNQTNYDLRQAEMWFVAPIHKIMEQTADPDSGHILQRDFFTMDEMAYKFYRWGKISKYLLEFVEKLKL